MKKEYVFTLLDETITWGFTEICTRCRVDSDLVFEMINEGILDPEGSSVETWRFNAVAIKRIQVACRLQNDLRVNLPGVALALDLLEELEGLRSRTAQLSCRAYENKTAENQCQLIMKNVKEKEF